MTPPDLHDLALLVGAMPIGERDYIFSADQLAALVELLAPDVTGLVRALENNGTNYAIIC